ncbi:hypothetical protein ACRAWD_06440 [Caulobacter segnis]
MEYASPEAALDKMIEFNGRQIPRRRRGRGHPRFYSPTEKVRAELYTFNG